VIKRVYKDYIIWEMKAEDDSVAAVVVERPDEISANAPAALGVVVSDATEGKAVDKEEKPAGERLRAKLGEDGEEAVQLPNAAVAVARGHLFVASHVDFLEKVLGGTPEADRLENDADYKRVNEELTKLGATEVCIRNFTRDDEQFRITY